MPRYSAKTSRLYTDSDQSISAVMFFLEMMAFCFRLKKKTWDGKIQNTLGVPIKLYILPIKSHLVMYLFLLSNTVYLDIKHFS